MKHKKVSKKSVNSTTGNTSKYHSYDQSSSASSVKSSGSHQARSSRRAAADPNAANYDDCMSERSSSVSSMLSIADDTNEVPDDFEKKSEQDEEEQEHQITPNPQQVNQFLHELRMKYELNGGNVNGLNSDNMAVFNNLFLKNSAAFSSAFSNENGLNQLLFGQLAATNAGK